MSNKWVQLGDDALKLMLVKSIESTLSMRAAASSIPMSFVSFRTHAKRFGLWTTNRQGKGLKRKSQVTSIPLTEILQGLHPTYSRHALKRRLLKEGIKQNICELCKLDAWRGKTLIMQLDHINGNSWDHRGDNLRMLCPNCHSQTPTYCGRNAT